MAIAAISHEAFGLALHGNLCLLSAKLYPIREGEVKEEKRCEAEQFKKFCTYHYRLWVWRDESLDLTKRRDGR